MCPSTELAKVRKKMTVYNELHVVDGGDHSLKQSTRASGLTQDQADKKALDKIAEFLNKVFAEAK